MIENAIVDLMGVAGLVLLSYGLYLVSPIHCFVIIGSLLLVGALLSEKGVIWLRWPYSKRGARK